MSLDPTGEFFRRYLEEGARRLSELEREIEMDALPELVARELAMKGVDLKDVNLMQRAELGCPLSRNDRRRVEFLKERGVEGDVVTVALERIKRRSSERQVRVTPLDRVSVPVKGPRRQEARDGDACKRSA